MSNRLKTLIISALTIIFIILLTLTAFSLSGKVKDAERKASDADSAAAAYASALAESNEKIDSVNKALQESREKEKEKEKEQSEAATSDHESEAALYAAFTAGDSEIRSALNALNQDEPELVKNFRIRVALDKMEDISLPGGEGKRVRFTGSFNPMPKRNNAVIRISSIGGSFKGKIYISNLQFNDGDTVDFSGLSGEDIATSHGSALISAEIASVNGSGCVCLDTDFPEAAENAGVSAVIPLNGLDSSEFNKVYYDLYFEGDPSSFSFTTGCDFTGKEDSAALLDEVNKAFFIYRGKVTAGQDAETSGSDISSAVLNMKAALGAYPETDPLVIKINTLLDEKLAAVGEGNGSNAETPASGSDAASIPSEIPEGSPVSSYSPIASAEGNSSLFILFSLLFALIAIIGVVFLALGKATSQENTDEAYPVSGGSSAAPITEPGPRDTFRPAGSSEIAVNSALIKEKLDLLESALMSSGYIDNSGLYSLIEKAEYSINELESLLSSAEQVRLEKDMERKGSMQALREITGELSGLSHSNDALSRDIAGANSQLEETYTSVKDINQAATIIADVASETNLLSLNASIEAARAGEAGRGFAVVAGEIQKLADQTEKSVSEISATVEKLNSDFRKTHDLMEKISSDTASRNERLSDAIERFSEAGRTLENTAVNPADNAELNDCIKYTEELSSLISRLKSEVQSIDSLRTLSEKDLDLMEDIQNSLASAKG